MSSHQTRISTMEVRKKLDYRPDRIFGLILILLASADLVFSSFARVKPRNQLNGTLSAQLNKSVNGTTVGNLAFVLNNPTAAYIWNNPLARILTRNSPNKNLQWQFGTRGLQVAAGGSAASGAARPAAGQASGGQPARPAQAAAATTARPAAAAGGSAPTTARPANAALLDTDDEFSGSFVVPAGRQ